MSVISSRTRGCRGLLTLLMPLFMWHDRTAWAMSSTLMTGNGGLIPCSETAGYST